MVAGERATMMMPSSANAYITAAIHVAGPGRRKVVGHKVEGNYDKRDSKY